VATAIAGGVDEELPESDRALAEKYLMIYGNLFSIDPGPLLDRAEARCRVWLAQHADAVVTFARQLVASRYLGGEDLRARLQRTFTRVHQPIPRGKALAGWLDGKREEVLEEKRARWRREGEEQRAREARARKRLEDMGYYLVDDQDEYLRAHPEFLR
jgi:hypothetical protein